MVRVLIPDHPDLYGRFGRAVEFGAVLRLANDPEEVDGEPWALPATLTDPLLEEALDAIVLHDWHREVGVGEHTAITVTHAGVQHMGLYVATGTEEQVALLAAADELVTLAESTPAAQRTPEQREIAEFVESWRDLESDDQAPLESLSAWQTALRLLTIATASHPAREHRPSRLHDTEGALLPIPAAGSSPAADTALLLQHIDAGDGRSIDLDHTTYPAWRRLTAEWHAAIYGAHADDPLNVLTSYTY